MKSMPNPLKMSIGPQVVRAGDASTASGDGPPGKSRVRACAKTELTSDLPSKGDSWPATSPLTASAEVHTAQKYAMSRDEQTEQPLRRLVCDHARTVCVSNPWSVDVQHGQGPG